MGLEIRHQHGFARIHAPDLGPDWQDRFQWDDEERRARLKEEAAARERMSASRVSAQPPKVRRKVASKLAAREKPVAQVPDPDQLVELRTLFSAWQSKVARLEIERDEAILNSTRQKSVPGRLETWSARAARLRGEVSKARVEFEAARARLAGVSPRDPLLMVPPDRSR